MNRIIILLFVICFFSCGINKKYNTSSYSNKFNLNELVENVNSSVPSPDWTSIKGKINIRSKSQKITLNTNIKIKKDSIIWVSVSLPIVGELFRGVITKDSIYYLDRKNSSYFIADHFYLNKFFTSDSYFYLANKIISSSTFFKNDIDYKFSEGRHIIFSQSSKYIIDPISFSINECSLISSSEDTLTINYLNYHLIDSYVYPKKINMRMVLDEEYNLSISYNKISLNKPQEFSFIIPKNYEKKP
jgi:hypothetical protein